MKVGVLALQGGFRPHVEALSAVGADAFEVRLPSELAVADALVVPGGESTTMSRLLDTSGLREPLRARIADGLPVLGTCAGMIVLASEILDGRPDQVPLGAIDVTVRRNAHGRQRDSFEAPVELAGPGLAGGPFPGVFIRAPAITRCGPGVEVVARLPAASPGVPGEVVAARQGRVIVCAFHPELSGDLRVHVSFVSEVP